MKRVWPKQPRGVYLRKARKPVKGYALSGVVKVLQNGIVSHAYVKFDEETVLQVAKFMPQGIGPPHPAYLKLVVSQVDTYEVWCCYLDGSKEIPLWVTQDAPEWLDTTHPA